MGAFQDSAAMWLSQVKAVTPSTTDALDIRLVDEGKAWWQDYIVPGATLVAALIGGIGGVLIGGRMNRNTMKALEADRAEREAKLEADRGEREARLEADRAERQARIEADRAEREAHLDSAKAARDEAAQRRLALGALKLLKGELEDAQSNLKMERDSSDSNPLVARRIDTQLHVRAEDKHAIAMWVSDVAWQLISLTLVQVDLIDALRAHYRERLDAQEDIDADDYRDKQGRLLTELRRR